MSSDNTLQITVDLSGPDFTGHRLQPQLAGILRDLADDIESSDRALLSGASLDLFTDTAQKVGSMSIGRLD